MTNLTEAAISSKKFVAPDIKYDDHNSLVIVAGKKGRHTWRIKTRTGSDRIGHYPAMSLKQARAIAEERTYRLAHDIPLTSTPAKPTAGMTIADLLDRYEQARRHEGLKTFAKSMKVLRRGLAAYLALDVAAFTSDDMDNAFLRMREPRTPGSEPCLVAANRFAAYASKLWTWSMKKKLVTENFSKICDRTKEKPRTRVLTMDELAAVWQATLRLEHTGSPRGRPARRTYGRMIRFLLLTGQRLSNGTELRHGDVVKGVWTQNKNKRGTPLVLILPDAVLAEVGVGEPHRRVFGSVRGGLLNNLTAFNDEVRALSGVSDWSHHTFRHTIASQLARARVPFEVREALLHHKLKGMGAIAAIYTHYEFEEEMRDALKLWADMVTKAAGPTLKAVA